MRERVSWGWEERLLAVSFGLVAYAVVAALYAFVVGSSIAVESAAAALVAFLLAIRVVSAFGRPMKETFAGSIESSSGSGHN